MRFAGALDAIFRLAVTGKPFDHLENTTWHKPTDCRIDGNDISDLEFVGHRFVAVMGALTLSCLIQLVCRSHQIKQDKRNERSNRKIGQN